MAKGESVAKASAVVDWTIHPVPINAIDIGAQMLRHEPDSDDVIELAADIAARGLLQPIGVSRDGARYQLRWGSRRLAAHVRLRRPVVMARIVAAGDVAEVVGDAARENLLRRDLTLREEIDAIRRIAAEGRNAGQIADLCGKSREWVNRRLAFDSLPIECRDAVLEGTLPLGHAEDLALLEDTSARAYLTSWAIQQRPSRSALRGAVEALASTPSFGDAIEKGAAVAAGVATAQALLTACWVCDVGVPLDRVVIVRCCARCAEGMAHAGACVEVPNA